MADMTSRELILGRIREANRNVRSEKGYEEIAREYQCGPTMERSEILKVFSERLHEYDARVWQATERTIPAVIGEALIGPHGHAWMVSDGFPPGWLPEGMEWRNEAGADLRAVECAAGAVVTCEAAIAHTGTIVLRGMRKITLLPDRLLCVVRVDQVVETVPEAFVRLQPLAAEALTFISGPSATADIEMTRIRGVHGPRSLDVVLLR